MISKKIVDNKIEFKDLMGSMLNLGTSSYTDDENEGEDYS
jgi:magnesium chelatase subunit I